MKNDGKEQQAANRDVATFAAGCFWGVEDILMKTSGILETEVGYSGGTTEHPTHEQVCTGTTGHAESIRIIFDPTVITCEQLLSKFFELHDPTTLDRQGSDIGSQYRSVIFYHTPEQESAARKQIENLNVSGLYSSPIITEITPASHFWPAEDYHQHYISKRRSS